MSNERNIRGPTDEMAFMMVAQVCVRVRVRVRVCVLAYVYVGVRVFARALVRSDAYAGLVAHTKTHAHMHARA